MSLLVDYEIDELVRSHGMIAPYVDQSIKADSNAQRVVSYGLSSAGYDVRLGRKFLEFSSQNAMIYGMANGVDPLDPDLHMLFDQVEVTGNRYILKAGEIVLAETVEAFTIPNNIVALCMDKSTYVRIGISVHATRFQPGWTGTPTLEIKNSGPFPVALRIGEGIAEVSFTRTHQVNTPYDGLYQNQGGVTPGGGG